MEAKKPAGNTHRLDSNCFQPSRGGLLVPADRSSQDSSEAFTSLLNRTPAIASQSQPGNPCDNALAESGWSTLKTELLPRGASFADLEKARLELAKCLDHYDNTQRLPPP